MPRLALSQETPKTAKRRVGTDSTAAKTATNVSKPVVSREQAAFKDWAKTLYETRTSAEKMTNRKQAQRDAWFAKSWEEREAKLLKKYHVDSRQLYATLKSGMVLKWATEKPEHREAAKPVLDPLIFLDEENAWLAGHRSSSGGGGLGDSAQDFARRVQASPIGLPR